MVAVNVIIPTFNRENKVGRAISSVLNQTFKDFKIIVVDDGSTDGTKDVVSRFGWRVTYLALSSNLGVSAARNTGIKKSKAPFIAFLDSDDYWLPEKLAVQTDFFETNPNAMVCQTQEIWIRKGRQVTPQKKHIKKTGDIFEPSLKLCLVSPSSVMIKRSLLKKVGLFDENLPACEDYDLWLRIACRYQIYLIEQHLTVKTGGHQDQLSSRYNGMDRFRIKALEKLLKQGVLNKRQSKAALEELTIKCEIYGNGCLKRGKNEEALFYLELPKKLKKSRLPPFNPKER